MADVKKPTTADEIALLKEQIAALTAQMQPVTVSKGPTPEEAAIANEPVTLSIPKDKDHMDDVIVMVNGKAYQIQRGKRVEVPRFVAEVLWNSQDQMADAADYMAGLQDDFDDKSSKML